jgi:3-hydroxyisobutyrate dehydrogenase-like beta-hydroxyacid dehydrogenase
LKTRNRRRKLVSWKGDEEAEAAEAAAEAAEAAEEAAEAAEVASFVATAVVAAAIDDTGPAADGPQSASNPSSSLIVSSNTIH